MTPAADGSFTITRKAPTKPGRYFLEVTGLDPRTLQAAPENPWRRSLFWVPVYVGVPEPTAPDPVFRAPAPNPTDVTTWGTRIVDGYNEARAAAGKKPLAARRPPRHPGAGAQRTLVARGPRARPRRGPRRQARRLRATRPTTTTSTRRASTPSPTTSTSACSSPRRGAACSARTRSVIGIGLTPRAAQRQGRDRLHAHRGRQSTRSPASTPRRTAPASTRRSTPSRSPRGAPPTSTTRTSSKVVQGFADEVCQRREAGEPDEAPRRQGARRRRQVQAVGHARCGAPATTTSAGRRRASSPATRRRRCPTPRWGSARGTCRGSRAARTWW